jgi:iron complex outermembrane receptor protein
MNRERSKWRRMLLLGGVFVFMLGLVGYAPVVLAQEEEAPDEAAIDEAIQKAFEEEITVTGTLIPRPTLEALSPVTVLGVEEITYTGVTRIEDLMATLPQAFAGQNSTWANGASGTATVDLRNIGTVRTLVLINGRRMAPGSPRWGYAPDLNTIPAAMIKRIDVLTGGASAVYGTDAVAGVVNFILDTEFEGMRGDVHYSFYSHKNDNDLAQQMNEARGFDYPTGTATDGYGINLNLAFGGKFADGRGHASAYVGYREIDAVTKGMRDYLNCSAAASEDGPSCGGSATTDRGTFVDANGDYYMIDPNQDPHALVPWDGYRFNYGPYNHIQRPDERWNAGAFLNYELNKHLEGYMELMFMNDETDAQIAPSGAFGVTNSINCDNPMLSAQQRDLICTQNDYGPDDEAPLIIYRRNVEGAPRSNYIRHTNYRMVAGFRGDITDNWSYDVYGLQAQTNADDTYENDLDIGRINDAIHVVGDPNDPSTWVCQSGNDGCVPYNVFQAGGVTQEATEYIATRLVLFGTTRTQVFNATVTGDLEDYGLIFPGSNEGLKLALGTQYRDEFLQRIVDETYRTGNAAGQGGPTEGVEGNFNVKELYTELLIPFLQDASMAHNLSVDLGYRYSDYSTSGGVNTYKGMLSWAPSTSVGIRGGFNRAIRSASIFELFTPAGFGLGGSEDICAGPNPANQYNTYGGGNPDLDPEAADTLTFGVVFTPEAIPGFSLTLDYYDIQVTDLISSFAYNDILTTCARTGDPALCNLIHRGVDGNLWYSYNIGGGYVETNQQNVGDLEAEGVDLTSSYTVNLGKAGFLNLDLTGTYVLTNSVSDPLRAYDCVGYFGYQCGQPNPEWKHRFRATWESDFNLAISLMWRYIGSVQNDDYSPDPDLANPGNWAMWEASGSEGASAYSYFDLVGTYSFTDNLMWTLGINNITSKEPPMWPDLQDDQYVNTYATYDPLGRYIYTSLQFNF